jgi:hypothetical protein
MCLLISWIRALLFSARSSRNHLSQGPVKTRIAARVLQHLYGSQNLRDGKRSFQRLGTASANVQRSREGQVSPLIVELSGFRPLTGGGLEGRGVSRMDQSHGLGGGGNGPH